MKGISNPDGWVRLDFPGGWPGDKKNAFTKEGMSKDEIAVQEFTKQLAGFRKNSTALMKGKLMHYVPDNGLYVYFRYDSRQTIMCIMNVSKENRTIHFDNYSERTSGFSKAADVISGNSINIAEAAEIKAGEMWILEMKN
jgi:hypothetical protein